MTYALQILPPNFAACFAYFCTVKSCRLAFTLDSPDPSECGEPTSPGELTVVRRLNNTITAAKLLRGEREASLAGSPVTAGEQLGESNSPALHIY